MTSDIIANTISTPGTIITDIRTWDEASSVLLQDNGRIVVVGSACAVESGDGDFVVVRYKSNGLLDSAFDGDGVVTTGFGLYDVALDAVRQPDGKLIVAGFTAADSGSSDLAMARYNSDGSLDASFGIGGKLVGHYPGLNTQASGMVLQDSKIVVVSAASGSGDFNMVRFDDHGSLDTTFGIGGFVQTNLGGVDESDAVVVDSDGRIVVAGISYPPGLSGSTDFVIARYNSNGSLDTTFDGDGKVSADFGGEESFGGLTLQSDHKVVVVGSSDAGSSGMNIAVARYSSNGSLDTTFDGDGKLITLLSGESQATSVRVQGDGKIVVAGVVQASAGGSGAGDFVVLRYNSNGTLDTGFGVGGKVVTDLGGDDIAESVALQTDGKIVVTGHTSTGGVSDIAVVRYNSDGTLDASFDGVQAGTSITDIGGKDYSFGSILQSDGKILVTGISDGQVALVRFNADGTLDTGFADNGRFVSGLSGYSFAFDVAALDSGSIFTYGTSDGAFLLSRYHADGTPDAGFGVGGNAITSIDLYDVGASLVLFPDRSVLAGGTVIDAVLGDGDFELIRYKSDGSLDTGFSADGLVRTHLFDDEETGFISLQPDGKILQTGSLWSSDADENYTADFVLVRYAADGEVDPKQ